MTERGVLVAPGLWLFAGMAAMWRVPQTPDNIKASTSWRQVIDAKAHLGTTITPTPDTRELRDVFTRARASQ